LIKNMTAKVLIREVGVREGFQIHPQVIATEAKLSLIDALAETGVKEIEVTSFVRADRVPQMADAEDLVSKLKPKAGVDYLGLYLNQKGFERAESVGKLNNKGWLYAAASALFLSNNSNTTQEQILNSIQSWSDLFKLHNKELYGVMISAAFGYPGVGRINYVKVIDVLRQIHEKVDNIGAKISEISLADTVGCATPDQVRETVSQVKKSFPASKVSLHLHDTHGLGIANAYAGYLEGVRIFESSVAGLGGCPFAPGASGNIVTEELVTLFEDQGIATGISLEKYIAAAHLAERIVGKKLPSKPLRAREHLKV
jgi:hydroxymethylglutaryl-CoA lyase